MLEGTLLVCITQPYVPQRTSHVKIVFLVQCGVAFQPRVSSLIYKLDISYQCFAGHIIQRVIVNCVQSRSVIPGWVHRRSTNCIHHQFRHWHPLNITPGRMLPAFHYSTLTLVWESLQSRMVASNRRRALSTDLNTSLRCGFTS
jgi:hypothetical protein